MTPETTQRKAGPIRRAPPRVQAVQAPAPRRKRGWQGVQDEMVERYADHAIEGGRRIAGKGVDDEAAIDAYLQRLRHDLLRLAAHES